MKKSEIYTDLMFLMEFLEIEDDLSKAININRIMS